MVPDGPSGAQSHIGFLLKSSFFDVYKIEIAVIDA